MKNEIRYVFNCSILKVQKSRSMEDHIFFKYFLTCRRCAKQKFRKMHIMNLKECMCRGLIVRKRQIIKKKWWRRTSRSEGQQRWNSLKAKDSVTDLDLLGKGLSFYAWWWNQESNIFRSFIELALVFLLNTWIMGLTMEKKASLLDVFPVTYMMLDVENKKAQGIGYQPQWKFCNVHSIWNSKNIILNFAWVHVLLFQKYSCIRHGWCHDIWKYNSNS